MSNVEKNWVKLQYLKSFNCVQKLNYWYYLESFDCVQINV